MQAEKFSKLEQRTRSSLLTNLVEELSSKTSEFLGIPAEIPTAKVILERTYISQSDCAKVFFHAAKSFAILATDFCQ